MQLACTALKLRLACHCALGGYQLTTARVTDKVDGRCNLGRTPRLTTAQSADMAGTVDTDSEADLYALFGVDSDA